MKIIDLLNKIANGEVPKKIKYGNRVYEYNKEEQDYGYFETGLDKYINLIEDNIVSAFSLLEEVEIIEEEKKIPEKLDEIAYIDNDIALKIKVKINEIIDYLKSKGE